jgi:hypothetical protein
MALVTEQNAQECEEADNLISNDVPEVFEWEQLIERTNDEDPPAPITVIITIDVNNQGSRTESYFPEAKGWVSLCQEKAITIQDASTFQ